MPWIPVVSGVFYKPVQTNVLPRIGESVLLPIGEDGRVAIENPCDEKVYRVIDVRHYIAYKETPAFEDVHLEEIR